MVTWNDESIYSLLVLKTKLLVSLKAHIKSRTPLPCAYTLDLTTLGFSECNFF